jgi:dTDP-4-amino-4,6-dideoxygalactose transaminase
MDPKDMERRITEKTKAIIPVHLYGYAADMNEINEIARKNDIKVIEDCAQGIGTEVDGKRVGQFGDCGAFSFFATKNMTTVEGGILTTDNVQISELVKILRNHGMTSRNNHDYIGYNYRMSEINAAIGLVQLHKLPEMNRKRIENSKYLLEKIKEIDWILIEEEPENVKHSYFWCPIRIDEEKLGMGTLELRKVLVEKGIETRHRYLKPLYKQKALDNKNICPLGCPTYSKGINYNDVYLENAAKFSGKVLGLPNHPKLSRDELDYIISILQELG